MAQYNSPAILIGPAGSIEFNADIGDAYIHDPSQCSGLDQAPLRTPIDDKPQTDGGIVHKFFKGARHVTLAGTLVVRTAGSETDYVATRNLLEDNLIAVLESIEQFDGTYQWTPTGSGPRSITVRCDVPVSFSGGMSKTYLFGLVAGDPTVH